MRLRTGYWPCKALMDLTRLLRALEDPYGPCKALEGPIKPLRALQNCFFNQLIPTGSFSSVAVHEMGLPRNAKKGGPRDPGTESLEKVFWL